MLPVKKSPLVLLLALLGTYAGATLASPVVSHSVGSKGVTVAQAQADQRVDCTKNPTDPRCQKR